MCEAWWTGCRRPLAHSSTNPAPLSLLSFTDLALRSSIILIALPGDGPLEEAAATIAKACKGAAGRTLISLGPASAAALAAAAKAAPGHDFVAAHVTGGAEAARHGVLLAHVGGGATAARATATRLLTLLVADAFDLGPDITTIAHLAGVAAILTAGLLQATAEAMACAEAAKIPHARAHVARLASEIATPAGCASVLGPAAAARRMAEGAARPAPPDAAVAALAAATRHGLASAKTLKAATAAATAAAVRLQQVEESGGGHLDAAALVAAVRDAAGLPP